MSWFHGAQTVSKARRTNLSGEWNGLVWPDDTSQVPAEIPVKFWFDASQKIIKGEMSFVSWIKNRGVIENILIGGFQNDCDLELIYAKKEDGVIGDGRFFLELSPDAKKIEGRVVGHSSHTNRQFHSRLLLLKGKTPDLKECSILKSKKPTIFIGHGTTTAWKELEKYLRKLGYQVVTFESGPRAGRTISDVLAAMMNEASFALLIMTGEDRTKEGSWRARQNVVYEIGFFHAKLGSDRAIILLEDGVEVEEFSNIHGLVYIPFKRDRISRTFEKVVATLKREFPG